MAQGCAGLNLGRAAGMRGCDWEVLLPHAGLDGAMDMLDAGVFVAKWEGRVPRHAKMTLWGPLQAREMGLEGWDVQDGGETGFVLHNAGTHLTMGRATSTLIFVRRLERAFLTVYFGGYPADAPAEQRRLDMQKAVNACELFLSRLAREPVKLEPVGELSLVDNHQQAAAIPSAAATAFASARMPAKTEPRRLRGGGGATAGSEVGGVDAYSVEQAARPKRSDASDIWEP